MSARPQLIVDQRSPAEIVFSVESPVYQPGWESVILTVVTQALHGQEVLGLTADPPVWDLEPAEVSDLVEVREYDGWRMALLRIAPDDRAALSAAVASSDFQLGTLLLAAMPASDAPRSEAFARAVRQAGVDGPVATNELFLECSDNTWLSLLNPSTDVFDHVCTSLDALTSNLNWDLAIRSPQGDI